jgi:GWxTD domain-containing protein
MKPRTLTALFCLFSLAAYTQVLRDINYNFQYNPELPFSFQWKVVRQGEHATVYFNLHMNDTTAMIEAYSIQWETRESISEKSGTSITPALEPVSANRWSFMGKFSFPVQANHQIVLAMIIQKDKKIGFPYYTRIPKQNSPYLLSSDGYMINAYVNKGQPIRIEGFDADKSLHVSYYNDPFPAGAPAFSTAQARVAKIIKPDSMFVVETSSNIMFTKKGLYLAQVDTASAQGLAFRVEEDYPKLGKLESLAGPLLYVCTKQEFEKVSLAGNDKKKFDQVILSITGNTERARIFIRNYYKRVELANLHFSSYKEGWKTDRGMIYIVFGAPEEVYLFEDREIWEYKNDYAKLRFQFVKSATVFDPDNYVLIRDKKFADTWYKMIDLWRKARF